MGLFDALLGNATQIDSESLQRDLQPVLAPGETVTRAFKLFRDLVVFTDHRLILIDQQGVTGAKVVYHTILYRSITQFAVQTAGNFDADAELSIWVSGSALPITKEFKRGTDLVGLQQHLAACIFAAGK